VSQYIRVASKAFALLMRPTKGAHPYLQRLIKEFLFGNRALFSTIAGGVSLTAVGKGDQMGDQDSAFFHWMRRTMESFASVVKVGSFLGTAVSIFAVDDGSLAVTLWDHLMFN
jgi:hypothetical protein